MMSRDAGGWMSSGLGERKLDDLWWIALDLETTGLDPGRDAIREYAAFATSPSGDVELITSWADVGGETGKGFVAGLETIAGRVVHGAVLVAHHLAFDLSFLAACPDAPETLVRPPVWLCSMRALAGTESLDWLADRLDVGITGRHTAVGDAHALACVLAGLVTRVRAAGGSDVQALLEAAPGNAHRRGRPGRRTQDVGGWESVRGGLDHVVPIRAVTRSQRHAFRSVTRLLERPALGPRHLIDAEACVLSLRAAGIHAAALDLLVGELADPGDTCRGAAAPR
jgi:hypothetical protein